MVFEMFLKDSEIENFLDTDFFGSDLHVLEKPSGFFEKVSIIGTLPSSKKDTVYGSSLGIILTIDCFLKI